MLASRCWTSSLVHLPQEIVSLQSTHTGQHGAHKRIAHTQTRTHTDAPHSKTGNLVKAAGYQNNTNIVDQAWMLQCPQLCGCLNVGFVSVCAAFVSCRWNLSYLLPGRDMTILISSITIFFLNECWDRNIQIYFFGRLLKKYFTVILV